MWSVSRSVTLKHLLSTLRSSPLISRLRPQQQHQQRRPNSQLASLRQSTGPTGFIYRLTSDDPFLNLSIEHYIFTHVPAGSRTLLFYINKPCVVIGRNQNPWVEINLRLLRSLRAPRASASLHHPKSISSINAKVNSLPTALSSLQERGLSYVEFVRRRSGGGTVFHDAGNVNWGVICDAGEFTRDKHAEMVVRGIARTGADADPERLVRVNDRHDIVIELPYPPSVSGDTAPVTMAGELKEVRKVSGSAYKLARGRALHHGTALCRSQNLDVISAFLQSPARSFISAKGVESVRSPIANLDVEPEVFMQSVEDEFRELYGVSRNQRPTVELGEECLDLHEIRDGYEELKSDNWRYLQTPQFDFHSSSDTYGTFKFSAKHGLVNAARWTLPDGQQMPLGVAQNCGITIHEVDAWAEELKGSIAATGNGTLGSVSEALSILGQELDAVLGDADVRT